MNWRTIRFRLYVATPFVVLPIIIALVLWNHYKTLPDATRQIGVKAQDFKAPVKEAMRILNGAAGCTIFVPGEDVLLLSTMGEPCGLAFHQDIEDGHSAGTYRCDPSAPAYRGYQWEVHVERPGNVRTQTCIAVHELLHVAGFDDTNDKSKAMYTAWCPPDGQIIWPADSESKQLARDFCEDVDPELTPSAFHPRN